MRNYERSHENLSFDFRTGRPTAITGPETGSAQRATCSALNAERAGGIIEADQSHAPGEPVSADVWSRSLERALSDWDTPLIDLSRLGLTRDKEGFLISEFLKPFTSGAEAEPYLDEEYGVVYKLFNLRDSGVGRLAGEFMGTVWLSGSDRLPVVCGPDSRQPRWADWSPHRRG